MNIKLKKLIYSAVFLALALVLPFLTGQIPQIGGMLCPMHIPVLLCGFICGGPWGALVGLLAPFLRYILFQMPPLYPTGLAMALELAVYGFVSGETYRKLPKKLPCLYGSLLTAMILGRLVWGAARWTLAGISRTAFDFPMFWAGAVATALPGIAVQLLLIPAIVLAMRKAKLCLQS